MKGSGDKTSERVKGMKDITLVTGIMEASLTAKLKAKESIIGRQVKSMKENGETDSSVGTVCGRALVEKHT